MKYPLDLEQGDKFEHEGKVYTTYRVDYYGGDKKEPKPYNTCIIETTTGTQITLKVSKPVAVPQ
ncbi:MAG TPA: hypothetical protein VGF75_08255 [Candidatus Saccharimonadales bacterium]|jgi:hypothetical protein